MRGGGGARRSLVDSPTHVGEAQEIHSQSGKSTADEEND